MLVCCILQVMEVNEEACRQICRHMHALSWLLPGHSITLHKRGQLAADGVELAFKRSTAAQADPNIMHTRSSDAEQEPGHDKWITDTVQLSGGQRTLLCLALMVAVSTSKPAFTLAR